MMAAYVLYSLELDPDWKAPAQEIIGVYTSLANAQADMSVMAARWMNLYGDAMTAAPNEKYTYDAYSQKGNLQAICRGYGEATRLHYVRYEIQAQMIRTCPALLNFDEEV